LDYIIFSGNDSRSGIVNYGTKLFAVSRYSQNPSGWAYSGNKISFDVNSESEDYFYGSNATFVISIRNNDVAERTLTVCGLSLIIIGRKQINIRSSWNNKSRPFKQPKRIIHLVSGGQKEIIYSIPVYSYDSLWASIYDGNESSRNFLATATRGFYAIDAVVDVKAGIDKSEYQKAENLTIKLNIRIPRRSQ
jgi:hypothetical protein